MKGAIQSNFNYDLILFLTGIPIIKAISLKGAILYPISIFAPSEINLKNYLQGLVRYLN